MFPLEIIFNIAVALVFLFFWGLSFVILYHLTRFGIGVQPKRFAIIFLLGAVIISGVALILFTNIDLTTIKFR